MNLSPNFTLDELTFSQTALRLGLPNIPTPPIAANLANLALTLLEPVRSLLGVPIHIDSGYRCYALNHLIGGAPDSAHLQGLAADMIPIGMDLQTAFRAIRGSSLPFDQLIIECNAWIHIALPEPGIAPRGECLLASGSPGDWTYTQAP